MKHLSESRVQEYLDNEARGLDEYEREHLQGCEQCRALVVDYRRIYAGLAHDGGVSLSKEFTARTMKLVRNQVQTESSFGSDTWWAALVGLLSCGIAVYYLLNVKVLLNITKAFSSIERLADFSMATSFSQLSLRLGDSLPTLIFAVLILAAVPVVDRILVHQKSATRVHLLSV